MNEIYRKGPGKLYQFYFEHGGPANIGTVMRAAKEHGVDFGVEDYRGYLDMGWDMPRPSLGTIDLIRNRLKAPLASLYDPCTEEGPLALSLVDSHSPGKVCAYQDRYLDKNVRLVRNADKVQWLNWSSGIAELDARYDAIANCFPTFVRTDIIGGKMNERQVTDNACLQIVVDASLHLFNDSVGAFILPHILTAVQHVRMIERLSLNGIFLHEMLCIKGGAYDPYEWGGNLIVLRREASTRTIAREIGSPVEGIAGGTA